MITKIMAENPEIKNPRIIYPGQVLLIDMPQQYTNMQGTSKPSVIYADEQTKKSLKDSMKKSQLAGKKFSIPSCAYNDRYRIDRINNDRSYIQNQCTTNLRSS